MREPAKKKCLFKCTVVDILSLLLMYLNVINWQCWVRMHVITEFIENGLVFGF